MADSRDILGKNRKFKGTSGVVMPKGSTAERANTESGEIRFNTTTELMEYYDGNQWKPIDAPPTISSVSSDDAIGDDLVLTGDGSTVYTITITGGNFGVGVNVKFIGSTGTEYTAGNINRVSGSSITCTTLSNMGTSDDPYDVQVINASGLAALFEDAFSYNAPPAFDTAAGTLGNVYNGQTISGSTFDASATDAEGNTITYSIVSGSLPGSGLSISSSTGLITGTLSGTPSLGSYPFTVRAATAEGSVDRQFSIQVVGPPFITATGGTILTDGDFKTHVFTGPGTFTVTNAGGPEGSNSVEYLVVAGGGGSGAGEQGGGGGAGGFRQNYPSPTTAGLPVTAQGYPITVGGGGTGGGPSTGNGAAGVNSVFSTITSAGGGAGGNGTPAGPVSPSTPGGSGGSGGGGGTGCGSGGSGNTPPVSPPQGNNGGNAGPPSDSGSRGGGGGGAGAAGASSQPGIGGIGSPIATTVFGPTSPSYGTPGPAPGRYFAGGGGGGAWTCGPAPGGSGGGGQGAGGSPGTAASGTVNTGGGAGGSFGSCVGASGGSGIVVIRYKFQ